MIYNKKLEIGQWITQYSVGYWEIVNIVPKYAQMDYEDEESSYKKGERIGDWILVKKGFTPKMKFRLDFEVVDSTLCECVSYEEMNEIQLFFEENPDKKEKFINAEWKDRYGVCPSWLSIKKESEIEYIQEQIKYLPETFTMEEFKCYAEKNDIEKYLKEDPSYDQEGNKSYMLYLQTKGYIVNEDKEQLYEKPIIKICEE